MASVIFPVAAVSNKPQIRRRNGIASTSKLEILATYDDMYVAKVDDKVVVKLGPRMDMGDTLPTADDGWKVACFGKDFCVWDKVGKGV